MRKAVLAALIPFAFSPAARAQRSVGVQGSTPPAAASACRGTLTGTVPTPFTCTAAFAPRPGMPIGAIVFNGTVEDTRRPVMISVSVLFGEQLKEGSYTEASTTAVRSFSIMAAEGTRPASAWVGASGTGDVPAAGKFELNISSLLQETSPQGRPEYIAHGTLVATLPAAPASASHNRATLKITF
ncbi:MAG TPA: hypothetical protein VGM20_13755 [Gemmatimonadales bacterium]|jgi:hypothetical protein